MVRKHGASVKLKGLRELLSVSDMKGHENDTMRVGVLLELGIVLSK